MIRISRVDVPLIEHEGDLFLIDYSIFYFTFPFRRVYTTILREGQEIYRESKRIWFFFGWLRIGVFNSRNETTHYAITCGRKK